MSIERPTGDERKSASAPAPEEPPPGASGASDASGASGADDGLPSARVTRRFSLSPIWIVPIAAAALVAYLGYTTITSHGPTITVTFETAAGLREEQTQVFHKSVSLGIVESIELSERADHVLVRIRMDARAESMLTKQTQFWVVRPRFAGGAIAALQTGLETLVSGAYIELDPGPSHEGETVTWYEGLEQPPAVRSGEPGTVFILMADVLGSVDPGTPIMHRHVTVGEVLDYQLDDETGAVSIRAFVRKPHDSLVHEQTHFWNASGLKIGMGAEGLSVQVESLRSVFSGGIAFGTAQGQRKSPRARPGATFALLENEAVAEIQMNGRTVPYVTYFRESIQGLAKGSPVQLHGVQLGNVTTLKLVLDPRAKADAGLIARVEFVLEPERALTDATQSSLSHEALRAQVPKGLRVVLETTNYLTGQKVLALTYVPDKQTEDLTEENGSLVLPSHTRGLGSLTDALSEVATRLNRIPYEEIGANLNKTLRSADQTLGGPELKRALVELASTLEEVRGLASEAREGFKPAFDRLPQIAENVDRAVNNANAAITTLGGADGDFQRGAQRLMTQVSDMARSIRLLADFLQQKPEVLIRGRVPEEKK